MTLKGALRSAAAAQRRMEREARRRQREQERQQKQLAKMEQQEQAAYEVAEYEAYLESLVSIHKEWHDPWDWETIYASGPPKEPAASHASELLAQVRLDEYSPGLVDKALKRVESTRLALAAAVDEAQQSDEQAHAEALEAYRRDYAIWAAKRQLAVRVLAGETDAYTEAVKRLKPFGELAQFVSNFGFRPVNRHMGELFLLVKSEEIVPQETKSLLKSGKLSVKQMPKTRFYGIYQDYVCSCVLRAGRELFALLPIKMAIVTAMANMLNTQTGHLEDQPILSVAIPWMTVERLNFEAIDPSAAMGNFLHRTNFGKTKGFSAVTRLTSSDLP